MKVSSDMSPPKPSRRRALQILAATSALGLSVAAGVRGGSASRADASLHRWSGTALGADAGLLIHHPDPAEAARLTTLALAEIERLERIYSLHRPNSALVRLNRVGHLDMPPPELVALLSRAQTWSEATGGAFDVTVQPLWELYRSYFSKPPQDPAGPAETELAKVRSLVDFRLLDVTPDRISLLRPGMAVTLNGIAQGDVTDRIADLLRAEGLTQSLISLGEMRALGANPKGRPWRVGIKDPHDSKALATHIDLTDSAMATSSITGTVFEPTGRMHHLFDPKSGRPSRALVSASVIARRAVDADAFSTALLTSTKPIALNSTVPMGVDRVLTIDANGAVSDWTAHA